MKFFRSATYAATFAALLSTQSATAAEQWCNGTVVATYVTSDGGVFVQGSWSGWYRKICSTTTEWKGVQSDVCLAWMAKLDAAVAFNKGVVIYYNNAPECVNAMPGYDAAPSPSYVMIVNT